MRKRLLIVYVFLFSYAGAVAHSIVPHHHHPTQKEAKKHHDHTNHSREDSSKNDHEDEGQLYFLNHASNADGVVNHAAINNLGKGKKIQFAIPILVSIILFATADHNVFHPPMDDRTPLLTVFYSRSLRAPPSLI